MPREKKATLLVKNIGQLVTMAGPVPRIGDSMNDLGLVQNGGIAAAGEELLAVGPWDEVQKIQLSEGCRVIDASGAVVTPGLIDPHTHPVFARTRELEFEMRAQGKSYMEIARSGGGIRSSVRDLRAADPELLKKLTRQVLDRMLAHGTTTIEAKSGYGLSLEAEIKSLEVIRDLNQVHPIDLVPTFLGAHEIPDEYRNDHQGYIRVLVEEMIPAVAKQELAEYSDIFCEEGVFSVDESRRIQQAARNAGLKLRFHADELVGTGGSELAAEMGAASADHIVYVSDAGIKALAQSGTVAILLPGTTFSLGSSEYAPARKLIETGATVALATDCNPGSSYTESLAIIVSLAVLQLKMTTAEALSAITVNAAAALDRAGRIGRLVPGLLADVVVWNMADYRELPYHYGVNLVSKVVKRGKVVVER